MRGMVRNDLEIVNLQQGMGAYVPCKASGMDPSVEGALITQGCVQVRMCASGTSIYPSLCAACTHPHVANAYVTNAHIPL